MAERRIRVADNDLKPFDRLSGKEFEETIFFLDNASFSNENMKYIDKLLILGNFQITNVAMSELEAWGTKKAREMVETIRKKWHKNIVYVKPEALYHELKLLEPLLPKTLSYNLIMQNFKAIFKVVQSHGIDEHKFSRVLKKEFEQEMRKKFRVEINNAKKAFTLKNQEEHEDRIINDIEISIKSMIRFLNQLAEKKYGEEGTKIRFNEGFKNVIHKDILIVQHYLLSENAKKHFPAYDKDTRDLILLYRDIVLVKAA